MKPRWFLEAAGLALLVSFPYFAQLLFPGYIALYHHHLNFLSLIGGLLLAMLIIFGLTLLVMTYFHVRWAPRPRAVVAAGFAALVLLRAVDCVIVLVNQWNSNLNPEVNEAISAPAVLQVASHIWFGPYFRVLFIGCLALLAMWKPAATQPFVRAIRTSIAGFSFCLLWVLPQLFYLAIALRPIPPLKDPHLGTASATSHRIVWILFDELSYDQVYDHRQKELALPNFQELHRESASFTNIDPSGFFTDRIVPSLISGRRVSNIRSDWHGRLLYQSSPQDRWSAFDARHTLFEDAETAGWKSGVVGWYNPYCRILQSVLVSCSWEPAQTERPPIELAGASEEKSFLSNAVTLVPVFLFSRMPGRVDRIGARISTFSEGLSHAQDLIRNGDVDFAFIHLPIPHPPGFYDRKARKLCACGNYLDNLVLADDTLGLLEKTIDQTPSANQTTLIVSSDHSWRIPLWRGGDDWTPEEEAVSGGRFDTRPVFLVHFPGQTAPFDIAGPTPEMTEHDIIAAMLQNKIKSPQDLLAFVHAQQPQSPPTAAAPH